MTPLINRILARIFSKRLWRWHDSLVADGKLFGSLVTDDTKLWRSSQPEIKIWLSGLTRLVVEKTMAGKVWISTRKIEPIKISKKVLTITRDDPLAKKATEACIESGKRYGEHYGLEILTLESDLNISDFFKRHNLTWNERGSEDSSFPSDIRDFYLHFKTWLNCVETGEPMMIMQQGTVFRAPVPAFRFKDVIALGATNSISAVSSGRNEIFYPKHSLVDVYCYAITPSGARKLIEATQREMTETVHKFICKRRVDVIYCAELSPPMNFMTKLAQPHIIVEPQESIWKSYRAGD